MKLNTPTPPIHTHEGAVAKRICPEDQLRRSVMSCLLWEKEFYEEGEAIAARITRLIALVPAETVSEIAIEARTLGNLRHVPLLIVSVMAGLPTHKHLVAHTLSSVIQRTDELTEFLAIYWKGGRKPLSAQIKKGLASAFQKFNAYSLAKYNRDGAIKLRDALFLCHAKPKDDQQAQDWKDLINGTLTPPDTWEVALSGGEDKLATWKRLIKEDKLGGLAILRNLRNMQLAKVPDNEIRTALGQMKADRILPYRFIAAAKYAPQFEPELEEAMFRNTASMDKMSGTTTILIDVSGSMFSALSIKSDLQRADAACGLAMLARELCEHVQICTFSQHFATVPSRRGFALRDAIIASQPHGCTYLGKSIDHLNTKLSKEDRLIVITDEQSHDRVPDPVCDKAYLINVASAKNGVGYGKWTHFDGFSESIIKFIQMYENWS